MTCEGYGSQSVSVCVCQHLIVSSNLNTLEVLGSNPSEGIFLTLEVDGLNPGAVSFFLFVCFSFS